MAGLRLPGLIWIDLGWLGSAQTTWIDLDKPGLTSVCLDSLGLACAGLDLPGLTWAVLGMPGLTWIGLD